MVNLCTTAKIFKVHFIPTHFLKVLKPYSNNAKKNVRKLGAQYADESQSRIGYVCENFDVDN